jgi:antitoxin component YwqK of YwqJK toxin-antitoxin module
MRFTFLIVVLTLNSTLILGQRFSDQVPGLKRYTTAEVLDSVSGIRMYNRLVPGLGGDSIRYNNAGYNLQGWQEDYYTNGKLLHKGFYVDGQIKVFKNFYENGQIERSIVISDPARCTVDIYYPNGTVRTKILYYGGNAQNEYSFFPNGNKATVLEKDKDVQFVYKDIRYFENGQAQKEFELIDKKNKKYSEKEYYENGKVKEEGIICYKSEVQEYQKDGEWIYYNEKGTTVKKEKYKNGKLQENSLLRP